MVHESQQAALADAASKVTYAGSGTAVASWLFSSQAGIAFGILIGLAGLAVNWYYKDKQDRREEQEHDTRMAEHNKRMGL